MTGLGKIASLVHLISSYNDLFPHLNMRCFHLLFIIAVSSDLLNFLFPDSSYHEGRAWNYCNDLVEIPGASLKDFRLSYNYFRELVYRNQNSLSQLKELMDPAMFKFLIHGGVDFWVKLIKYDNILCCDPHFKELGLVYQSADQFRSLVSDPSMIYSDQFNISKLISLDKDLHLTIHDADKLRDLFRNLSKRLDLNRFFEDNECNEPSVEAPFELNKPKNDQKPPKSLSNQKTSITESYPSIETEQLKAALALMEKKLEVFQTKIIKQNNNISDLRNIINNNSESSNNISKKMEKKIKLLPKQIDVVHNSLFKSLSSKLEAQISIIKPILINDVIMRLATEKEGMEKIQKDCESIRLDFLTQSKELFYDIQSSLQHLKHIDDNFFSPNNPEDAMKLLVHFLNENEKGLDDFKNKAYSAIIESFKVNSGMIIEDMMKLNFLNKEKKISMKIDLKAQKKAEKKIAKQEKREALLRSTVSVVQGQESKPTPTGQTFREMVGASTNIQRAVIDRPTEQRKSEKEVELMSLLLQNQKLMPSEEDKKRMEENRKRNRPVPGGIPLRYTVPKNPIDTMKEKEKNEALMMKIKKEDEEREAAEKKQRSDARAFERRNKK